MNCESYENSGICLKGFMCDESHTSTVEPSMRSIADAILGNLHGLREEMKMVVARVSKLELAVGSSSLKHQSESKALLKDKMDKLNDDIIVLKGAVNTNSYVLGVLSQNLKKIGVGTVQTDHSSQQTYKGIIPQIPDRLGPALTGNESRDRESIRHVPMFIPSNNYIENINNMNVTELLLPPLLLSSPLTPASGSIETDRDNKGNTQLDADLPTSVTSTNIKSGDKTDDTKTKPANTAVDKKSVTKKGVSFKNSTLQSNNTRQRVFK